MGIVSLGTTIDPEIILLFDELTLRLILDFHIGIPFGITSQRLMRTFATNYCWIQEGQFAS